MFNLMECQYKYSLFVKEFTSQIEIFNMDEEYEHEICVFF